MMTISEENKIINKCFHQLNVTERVNNNNLFQRAQWHSLLSTKYQRLKPELKLMLSLEDDTQSKPAESQPSAGHQQQTQHGDDGK